MMHLYNTTFPPVWPDVCGYCYHIYMYSCLVRAEARGRHHQPSFQFFICKKKTPEDTNNGSQMINRAKCYPTPSEGADVRWRSVSNYISLS